MDGSFPSLYSALGVFFVVQRDVEFGREFDTASSPSAHVVRIVPDDAAGFEGDGLLVDLEHPEQT